LVCVRAHDVEKEINTVGLCGICHGRNLVPCSCLGRSGEYRWRHGETGQIRTHSIPRR
jgi:hypothetical protein